MQQTPQVGWDPIAIDYRPPLALKLLVLYLLAVVSVFYCTPWRFPGCPACEPNFFTCS